MLTYVYLKNNYNLVEREALFYIFTNLFNRRQLDSHSCFYIQSVGYYKSCSFWKMPLYFCKSMQVKKRQTMSEYYYDCYFNHLKWSQGFSWIPRLCFENKCSIHLLMLFFQAYTSSSSTGKLLFMLQGTGKD